MYQPQYNPAMYQQGYQQQQPNFAGSTVSLHPMNSPQTCLSVEGSGQNNGTKIMTWGDQNLPNQQWMVMPRPDGKFSLRPMHAQQMALDFTGQTQQQCHIWQADDNNANQGWSIEANPAAPGSYTLRCAAGAVLDCDLGTGGGQGSKIHTWSQTGAPNQAFQIKPCMNAMVNQPGFPFEGTLVQLFPSNAPQTCVSVEGSGQNNGTKIMTWGDQNLPNQRFRCHRRANGCVSLHPVHAPHMALDTTGNVAQQCHIWQADDNNANQNWTFQPNPAAPGSFILRTAAGSVLDCDLGTGGGQGSKIHTWQPTGAPNQTFNVTLGWQ